MPSASMTAPGRRPPSRILSLVLGAAAIAAGAGDAGMGIFAAGQQAALGYLPGLHPGPGIERRPGRRVLSFEGRGQRQGQHRVLQEAAEPGISPRDLCQGQLRPHPPAVERAHRRTERDLPEGSGLEPADRSGARGPLPAGQGQADRLRHPQRSRQNFTPRPTRASRPITPEPMPITSALIRTKPMPRPTLCSPPIPTTHSSSS